MQEEHLVKILIRDWAGSCTKELMRPYEHNQIIEGDRGTALQIINTFLDANLNVMICKSAFQNSFDGQEGFIISVDSLRFSQR